MTKAKAKAKPKHYPKNLHVPQAEVLTRREERRRARKKGANRLQNLQKVQAQNLKQRTKTRRITIGTLDIKQCERQIRFRLQGREHEYSHPHCHYHVTHVHVRPRGGTQTEAEAAEEKNDYDVISLRIREINRSHIDWFWQQLRTNTLPMKFMLRVFPNVKEQSENVAAFRYVAALLDLKQTTVIVVGDGATPRCGALFSCFARSVYSVDPMMRQEFIADKKMPSNLTCVASKVEDWISIGMPQVQSSSLSSFSSSSSSSSACAIVAVHAHVPFQDYLSHMFTKIDYACPVVVLALECCVPLYLDPEDVWHHGLTSFHEHEDWGILSPERTIRIWHRR